MKGAPSISGQQELESRARNLDLIASAIAKIYSEGVPMEIDKAFKEVSLSLLKLIEVK